MEEADQDLQDYISQGLQELLDHPDPLNPPPRGALLPISQVIPYPVELRALFNQHRQVLEHPLSM